MTPEDGRWLDAAARYAAPFLATTGDNPAVAALVVEPRTQTLLARAVTAKGGRPHAESQAIAAAGFDAAGATLYVTLEPCHHWGRTPPCVDAIIRAGIMRVVIGAADPRPAGGSVAQLQSAGVETILAHHAPSMALHVGHLMRHTANRPFVTAVLPGGAPGPRAQQWLDMLRTRTDAVLIGAATARADNPALTVTLPGLDARTPLRIVLAGAAGLDRKVNLIGGFSGYRTAIIAETNAPIDAPASVEVMRVAGANGRPDLKAALAALAEKHIQNLLVEPGPRLIAALLDAGLVDRLALIAAQSTPDDDTNLAAQITAACLIAVERQPLGEDELTLYERMAPTD